VAIVGLNPGGKANYEADISSRWSAERGSAYVVEQWPGRAVGRDPLQVQVQRLCGLLNIKANETFSGQFVPFRSDRWSELPRRAEAVAFARQLWAWTLGNASAQLFVCLGKEVVAPQIAALIGAKPISPAPSAWGDFLIDRYEAADRRLVLGLPHLGRFRLFGDPVRDAAFLAAVHSR
jgi:hypothetical protein